MRSPSVGRSVGRSVAQRAVPAEFMNVLSAAGALAAVVAAGAGLSSLLPDQASFWLAAAAYGAPAGVAFTIYWWNAQRL